MSANMYYEQVNKKKGVSVPTGAPNYTMEKLNEISGGFGNGSEVTLNKEHLDVLKGMSIVSEDEAYLKIIEGIKKYGEIRVYLEW